MPTTADLIRTVSDIVLDLEDSEGELTPAIEAALAALGDELPAKVEALHYVCTRLTSEETYLGAEAGRLMARKSSLASARERLKSRATELLLGARELGMLDGGKLRTPRVTAWLQGSTSVEGPEKVECWPPEWQRTKTVTEPDKERARKDLEAGATAPNVRLVVRETVRWR